MDTQKLSKSLNSFLIKAKSNLLWITGFMVFIYLFNFLIWFYPYAPIRIIDFKRKLVELDLYAYDNDKSLQLSKILNESISITSKNIDFLKTSYKQPMTSRKLKEGIQLIDDTRFQLAYSIGFLQGTNFNNPRLSDIKKGFVSDLQNIDSKLATFEEFYRKRASENNIITKQSIDKLNNINTDFHEIIASLFARTQSLKEQDEVINNEYKLAISTEKSSLQSFKIQYFIAIFAIMYETGFIIIGIQSWLESRRKQNKNQQKSINI
jgi:hypothetical protein